MSTLVLLVRLIFLVLLSIAFILIHNSSHATKTSSSNSLVLSLTRSSISTHEFPIVHLRGRRTIEDLSVPLTELPYAFMISLAIGTPPQVVHNNIFDTGSDLVWVPCGSEAFMFNCIDCDDFEPDFSSIFNPRKSHSIKRESCSSDLCFSIHASFAGYPDMCTIMGCSLGSIVNDTCSRPCPSFAYTYGRGALAGILATDILDTTNDHHSRSKNTTTYTSTPNINITFGCAHSVYKLPLGIVGFGKGPLSLPSQLGFLSKGFSHCFLPYQFSYINTTVSTPLILGDEAISSDEPFQYTPMLSNPNPLYQFFYYVGLESITVGTNTTIQAPASLRGFDSWGDGGMMVDSGTTITQLPEKLYWKIISILISIVKHPRAKEVEQHSLYDLCYVVPIKGNDTLGLADDLPSLTFNFLGGASLPLPHGNTFRPRQPVNGRVVKCFAFRALDDAEPDCDAIFGNFQQHNVKVVYDLEKQRFGFLPTDCLAYAQTYGLNT